MRIVGIYFRRESFVVQEAGGLCFFPLDEQLYYFFSQLE